jgi:hypothetical protein
MASEEVSRTPIRITLLALFVLTLLVAALRGVDVLTDRAALGALGGLASGTATLSAAWFVVRRRHGGPTRE